jgi:hypothetical protein
VVFQNLDPSKPLSDPANVRVASLPLQIVRCPSDINLLSSSSDPQSLPGWWRNNYRGNGGNDTGELNSNGVEHNNGVFVTGRHVTMDQITDGLSNTALFSEGLLGDGDDNVVSSPGDWFVIAPATHDRQDIYSALQAVVPLPGAGNQFSYAGRSFTSGNYVDSRYNHIMPPNGSPTAQPCWARSTMAPRPRLLPAGTPAASTSPWLTAQFVSSGMTSFSRSGGPSAVSTAARESTTNSERLRTFLGLGFAI